MIMLGRFRPRIVHTGATESGPGLQEPIRSMIPGGFGGEVRLT